MEEERESDIEEEFKQKDLADQAEGEDELELDHPCEKTMYQHMH